MGGSLGKYLGNHDNDAVLQPIVTTSQSRRICASLCMNGLGGEKCGDFCLDIAPYQLPYKQQNDSKTFVINARTDACPVLCDNHLGYPLCHCRTPPKNREINFIEVCGFFCVEHHYRIDGCQPCNVYQAAVDEASMYSRSIRPKRYKSSGDDIDWEEWCRDRCKVGDGGVACNCDLLPMVAPINPVPIT